MVLLCVTAVLTLAAVEIVLRFNAHRILPGGEWVSTQSIFRIDDALGMGIALRPGATRLLVSGGAYTARDRINSLGTRGPLPPVKPEAGRRRILVLGDSFVYGQGVPVDDALPSVLQEKLQGPEVINAGIPGYTLGQEYVFYREVLRDLDPDLVLVGFFMNDLDETRTLDVRRTPRGVPLVYSLQADAPLRKERRSPSGIRSRLSTWLRSRSLLYTIARKRLDQLRVRQPHGEAPAGDDGPPEPPSYMHIFETDPSPDTIERWEQAWNTLDALQELVARDGGRMLVFYIPATWQISDQAMSEWASYYGRDPAALDRGMPQAMLERWARRSGGLFVDLLPHFERHSGGDLYFPYDLHWTPGGHAVAAEALRVALREAGLI